MNAIAVFVASGLVARMMTRTHVPDGRSVYTWVYDAFFVPWAGALNGSLAFAIATILFWYGVMWALYRRDIFIKI